MLLTDDFADGKIVATCTDAVGTLAFANAARKNALDAAMWRAVPKALHWLTAEAGARVVIVRGAGDHDFSAGADISEFDTVRKDTATARIYEAENSAAFAAVRECPVPTIAAIRGICFGGGFGLAAACDLRIADQTARFSIPPARLGLAYPADAVADITASLGNQMGKLALFTGAIMDAERMAASGFLLEVTSPDRLEAEVLTLAETISGNAPLSVRAAKLALLAVARNDDVLLRQAEIAGAATFESEDYAEGRAAFAAKRKPVFTGK